MMDNFAFKYGERFDEVVEEYLEYKLQLINELMSVEWIIFGVACAVLLIIAVFFIRPSISMVFYEFDLVRGKQHLLVDCVLGHCCSSGYVKDFCRGTLQQVENDS